jgi:hypothetical protein
MIELTESGYTLRQSSYSRVTHVTSPDGEERSVIGPKLTQENVKRIILAAGKSVKEDTNY